MPVCRAVTVLFACLLALALAACASGPLRHDVVAQAKRGGKVAFDVVKLDNAVLNTILAQKSPDFRQRFKQYQPPPELKIAVGDAISVVIWEAAADGLFGNSLTELSFPAGAAAKALAEQGASLGGVPSLPLGMASSPNLLALMFGGAQARNLAAAAGLTGGAVNVPGGGQQSQKLQKFLDEAAQSGQAGTRIPDQLVGSDGAISIPYAGRIRVAGLTPEQVGHRIEALLGPKALDPQALVIDRRSAANSVAVAGEVIRGARVPLSGGGDRLLQVIAAAGGAKAPIHDTFVRLSRGGVTATVPLATLVAEPDQDIYARPGDVLTLVQRPTTYSVFGAAAINSTIAFHSDRLSLSEALARAGGLDDNRADPRAVFLFRYEPVGLVRALGQPIASDARGGVSPVVYRLDLNDAGSYLVAQRFPVHDKDVIFVADAASQPLYHFFSLLGQITGPIDVGLITCHSQGC